MLLEVLINNRNIALSRERLLDLVWGYDFEWDVRTVDVHITKLRKKLGLGEYIKTVYIAYKVNFLPYFLSPIKNKGIFNINKNSDNDK